MDKKKTLLISVLIVLLVVIIAIAANLAGDDNNSSSVSSESEVDTTKSSEVVANTSDIDKLKSSEYTSTGFDNIQIGDSIAAVEENIGTLEQLDIESEFDTYTYRDEELGSSYVFYFSNGELKEVSVFLA